GAGPGRPGPPGRPRHRPERLTVMAGRTVVVGAGLAGLSAAIHLAAAGREVGGGEAEAGPGGRCGTATVGAYRFDTGPSVLTMPEVVRACVGAAGEELEDWLGLAPPDPTHPPPFPTRRRPPPPPPAPLPRRQPPGRGAGGRADGRRGRAARRARGGRPLPGLPRPPGADGGGRVGAVH